MFIIYGFLQYPLNYYPEIQDLPWNYKKYMWGIAWVTVVLE